ncbi:MAG: mechanosensitive ion channel family protein [Chloroflexota bacterium]|nr:MAG: mechanosensitive ion channel family protein [Chloroflexota bacterium]
MRGLAAKLSIFAIIVLVPALLLVACAEQTLAETPFPTPTPIVPERTPEPADAAEDEQATASGLEEIIATRAPIPTATPGFLAEEVTELVESTGLASTMFLGLTIDNWINLAISAVIVVIAYAIGTLLTKGWVARWMTRYTSPEFAEVMHKSIAPRLRWLIVIPAFYLATIRLDFISAGVKRLLGDVYFVLGLILATLIVWSVIDLAYGFYRQKSVNEGREDQLHPILLLLRRIANVTVIAITTYILFAHFGVNITALLAAFGIAGLALSLAAQDTLADAIAGFIILADQPYRVGDRIEIQGEGTWGDVVDIGLRTTRIRTRDNRMVIVPNSVISKNQVINYTFPDPRYRIQMHIGIGYGSDIEEIRQLIVETVREVEGVLPDRPVDSLYIDMGDSAMIFRVRWWIESYEDTRRMYDRVNTALQNAFDARGIETPFPTHTMNLQVDKNSAVNLSEAFREETTDE